MARWYYRYAGLDVASDLCLPEWQVFELKSPCRVPDVEIRLEERSTEAHTRLLSAEEYRFQIEGVGEYWVQSGRVIRIAMYPNAGLRETRLFLLGSAWGALCYQRDILVLHASVVEVHGQAVAFCGVRGAGKSSVAAWLVAQGYRLIADDLCRIDVDGTPPRVYPAAPRLKLWRETLAELGWELDDLERDHFRTEKFHVAFHARQGLDRVDQPDSPLPLRAIYLLGWGEPKITRLTGLAALNQLIESATYRGDLVEPMGKLAAHWQRSLALAHDVPIFKFTRPADWSAMPSAMQMLLALWQRETQTAL